MATFLALSSMVARGHVGLSAIVPALQRLGHEAVSLPTVLLSNHPGHAHRAGMSVEPRTLEAMLAALDANRWLCEVDAVLTGYMPSAAHVRFAVAMIEQVKRRRPDVEIFCDPIIGDATPGLYIPKSAAETLRDELLRKADATSPNAFELGWLTGREVVDIASSVEAARTLGVRTVVVTSVPDGEDHLANVLVTEGRAYACTVDIERRVPNGTGDFLMAAFAAHSLSCGDGAAALAVAVGQTTALVNASLGASELAIVSSAEVWQSAPPAPMTRIEDTA